MSESPVVAHNLGFPRIGADRELKKALEAYWRGDLPQAELEAVGRELRLAHWKLQADAGLDFIPTGDFAWYDQVLTLSATPIPRTLYMALSGIRDISTKWRAGIRISRSS